MEQTTSEIMVSKVEQIIQFRTFTPLAMSRKSLIHNLQEGARSLAKRTFTNPYAEMGLNVWQVKALKHLPEGKLRNWRIAGHPLWFTSPSELMHGLKEIFAEKIYDQTLPENAYVIDCGANIGLSVIYLKKICPSARIEAFEPDPANFSLLQKNITSFGLQNVEAHQAAIWKDDSILMFESAGSMGSSINPEMNDGGVKVKAVRLKNLLDRPVDFLKIDIEGAEYEVIKDSADSLHQVKRMFLEYHGQFEQNDELLEMLNIVRAAGFKFYIREAAPVHPIPFRPKRSGELPYDVQLNIFCLRKGD
jgi:FkbM family methyltransferase